WQSVLLNQRIGIRTRRIRSAPQRIPIRQRGPDPFARSLRLLQKRAHIDLANIAVLHHNLAINDHRLDIIADAALDQALDRIAVPPLAKPLDRTADGSKAECAAA